MGLSLRRSKIVATIGPASEDTAVLEGLIKSGVNLCRFNLKYNTSDWHNDKIKKIRKIAKKLKTTVGIIVDYPRADFGADITDFDYVALSYLKSHREIVNLKERLTASKRPANIIAKIENQAAVDDLANIVNASDGVMVARGDLAIRTPLRELAYFQKKIIDICRKYGKPVIVATEMLYSMRENLAPTRAEATDVANAVFDGSDALMLSEETAIGRHPAEAVKTMDDIARFCENTGELRQTQIDGNGLTENLLEAAVKMAAGSSEIKGILVFTKSGASARLIARYRPGKPLLAISDDDGTIRRLSLSYGVIPYFKNFSSGKYLSQSPIFEEILKTGIFRTKDTIVVIHGNNWLEEGSVNQLSLRQL